MKRKILWVTIILVFVAQIATAQKVENVSVAIDAYKQFEVALLDALGKYRTDYLKNGVSAAITEEELVAVAQNAVFEAFMADKEKVVDALLSKPVTVKVNINLSYDKSKDFPILQEAYVAQMKAFWNGYSGRGVKESLGYTPRSGESESTVAKTTTTVTEEVNGKIKSQTTTSTTTTSTKDLDQTVQTSPRTVNFKTPKDLEPYVDPLLTAVKNYVHQWISTWQIH